jgi:hypothetical protein
MTRAFKTRNFQRWMRKTELTDTLVVSNGRTLGDDELRYISFMSARAQTPGVRPWAEGLVGASGLQFFEATGGRGTLDFRLDGTFAGGFEGN